MLCLRALPAFACAAPPRRARSSPPPLLQAGLWLFRASGVSTSAISLFSRGNIRTSERPSHMMGDKEQPYGSSLSPDCRTFRTGVHSAAFLVGHREQRLPSEFGRRRAGPPTTQTAPAIRSPHRPRPRNKAERDRASAGIRRRRLRALQATKTEERCDQTDPDGPKVEAGLALVALIGGHMVRLI